jgi:pimeloyl-ACP methyl ester carboxylesterase
LVPITAQSTLQLRLEAGAVLPVAAPAEFEGPGGLTLRGLRFGAAERWIVLVHDEGRDLDGWRRLAVWLAEHGFCALAFDLPGHGASDAPWDPALAPAAVLSALAFATGSGARQLHLGGEGVGATAVLAAAAAAPDASAAILASPSPDERVAPFAELREARLPKLILVGSQSPGAVAKAEAIYRGSIGPCELVQFPVADQGTALFGGDWGGQACEKTLAHLWRRQ